LTHSAGNTVERRTEVLRWGICFALVVAMHGVAALRVLVNASAVSDFDAGAPVPVVMELPEIAAAPATPPNDVEPEPPQLEAEQIPPPPEEQIKPPEEVAELALPIPEPPKPQPPVDERLPTSSPSVEIPPSEEAPPTPGAEVEKRRTILRWQTMLAAHLERFKRYPSEARNRGEQGVAKVTFTIDHEGRLVSSRIVQSSGSPTLDQETLDVLARAQPMPRPPEKATDNQLSLTLPVRFSINYRDSH
jgi:periplasmic protein TonB